MKTIAFKNTALKQTRLLVGIGVWMFAATVQADIYSAPGLVDGIEQETSGSGVTYVHLQSSDPAAHCIGRGDGYFVIPSGSKQLLQMDMLLSSVTGNRAVTFRHNPSTCIASSVSLCRANPGLC